MKLLIYSHAFAPGVGGVETVVMSLATGLAALDVAGALGKPEVTVVTPAPRGTFDDAALPFRVVRQPRWMTLWGEIWKADVVHLAGPAFLPMLYALLVRKPVVVEHSGYHSVCPNGLLLFEPAKTVCPGHFMAGRYGKCLRCNAAAAGGAKSLVLLLLTFPRRWMCGRVAQNIFPSNHLGLRVELPRGVRVYHGAADPVHTRPSPAHGASGPPCFAFIGRLVWEKGVDVLLRACREIMTRGHDFRLKIIGDGCERPGLEAMVDRWDLRKRTVFTGYLQGEALAEALREVSVIVMPSLCEETAGFVAIEQMLRGRLVIASDTGGLGEYVGGVGLKFAPGDSGGLASCLQRVLEDRGLAEALGDKARRRAVQLFREERMVTEHFAIYREVLGTASALPEGDSAVARPLRRW